MTKIDVNLGSGFLNPGQSPPSDLFGVQFDQMFGILYRFPGVPTNFNETNFLGGESDYLPYVKLFAVTVHHGHIIAHNQILI